MPSDTRRCAGPKGARPRAMAISDPVARQEAGLDLDGWLDLLLDAGVDTVQLREKADGRACDPATLLRRARRVVERADGRLQVLVNGRADIALAAGADGVHLPASGLPTRALRRRFPSLIVGRSTHSRPEALQARDDGADYMTFSPIFATPSKARFGAPQGVDALAELVADGLPVVALGGIDPETLRRVAPLGVGCAAIRAFHDAESCRSMVDGLRTVDSSLILGA